MELNIGLVFQMLLEMIPLLVDARCLIDRELVLQLFCSVSVVRGFKGVGVRW